MKFFDTHIHSTFSPDSRASIEQYAVAANHKGLAAIAITDHLDIDAPLRECDKKNLFLFDPIERDKEIDRVKEIYGTTILKGIEVGLQPHCLEEIKEFTQRHKFDSVIASLHFIDREDPYFGDYYIGKSARQAYGHAYEVMYRTAVEYGDFDIPYVHIRTYIFKKSNRYKNRIFPLICAEKSVCFLVRYVCKNN